MIALVLLFFIIKPSLAEYSVYQDEIDKKIKLGYCPTMQEDAIYLSKENDYELISFGSAIDVLSALKNNQIDKAMIGRKAELSEINQKTKETILRSGYTLVSDKKGFIDYSQLHSIEVYTYLPEKITSSLIPTSSKIIYTDKNKIIKKINDKKIVLISWDDWDDEFELIVIMDGNEKVKGFRGVFLYEK